jgi:hypothetical protein
MNTLYYMIAGMACTLNVLLYSGTVPFEAETYLFPIVAVMMLCLAMVAFVQDWMADR